MQILHDNIIEREDVDEDLEKSSFFFLTTHHSEIDLFETRIWRLIELRIFVRFDALSTILENSRDRIILASDYTHNRNKSSRWIIFRW
jgi:hypothetical protein